MQVRQVFPHQYGQYGQKGSFKAAKTQPNLRLHWSAELFVGGCVSSPPWPEGAGRRDSGNLLRSKLHFRVQPNCHAARPPRTAPRAPNSIIQNASQSIHSSEWRTNLERDLLPSSFLLPWSPAACRSRSSSAVRVDDGNGGGGEATFPKSPHFAEKEEEDLRARNDKD